MLKMKESLEYANSNFRRRLENSKTIRDSDEAEGYRLAACLIYPIDLFVGFYRTGMNRTFEIK